MKLSLKAFMVSLAIANVAYAMDEATHREPSVSPISLELVIEEHDAATKNDSKKSNSITVQEVRRLTLYAIAEKQLVGTKKNQ